MANLNNTLYPPQVATFMPAFTVDDDVKIHFSLSPYNQIDQISRVHISIQDQRNNLDVFRSVVSMGDNTLFVSNGIYVVQFDREQKEDNGEYFIYLPKAVRDRLVLNNLYKVQFRFDSTTDVLPAVNSSKMKSYIQDSKDNFSEWSTVLIMKPIPKPVFEFTNVKNRAHTVNGPVTLVGKTVFKNNGNNSVATGNAEYVSSFDVKVVTADKSEILVYDKVPSSTQTINQLNTKIDLSSLQKKKDPSYLFSVSVITNSGYVSEPEYLSFRVVETAENPITFNPVMENVMDRDDGIVNLKIKTSSYTTGRIHIKRSCEDTEFKEYVNLGIYSFKDEIVNFIFEDDTFEPLKWYRYACVFEPEPEVYTKRYYAKNGDIFTDCDNMVITRDKRNFVVRYNGSISNITIKNTRTSVETLGGKYPKFVENGNINYRTYSVGGYISGEADALQHFLNKKEYFSNEQYTRYLKYINTDEYAEKCLRNDVWSEKEMEDALWPEYSNSNNRNKFKHFPVTIKNDRVWERAFREEAISWLNDGKPKLMRTFNEGNRIVILSGISVSPDKATKNLLYTFTATATEVAEPTVENMIALGILNPTEDPFKDTIIDGGSTYVNVKNTFGRILNFSGEEKSFAEVVLQKAQNALGPTREIDRNYGMHLSNIRIYFKTKPKPILVKGDEGNEYLSKSNKLAHEVYLQLKSDDNKKDNLGIEPLTYKVVGDYAQIPATTDVMDLRLEKDDVAIIDYNVNFRYALVSGKYPKYSLFSERRVGQEIGLFRPDEEITKTIRKKYFKNTYRDNILVKKESMKTWTGICVTADPYSVFSINGSGQLVVGMTGVFNLMEGLEIDDFRFIGKKLFKRDYKDLRFIRNTEFVVDPETYSNISDIETPKCGVVYALENGLYRYYNGRELLPFKFTEYDSKSGIVETPIYATIDYIGNIVVDNFIEEV